MKQVAFGTMRNWRRKNLVKRIERWTGGRGRERRRIVPPPPRPQAIHTYVKFLPFMEVVYTQFCF